MIHLPRGTRSKPHDHGESIACEVVVEGELTNCIYDMTQKGTVCLRCADVYPEQSICVVDPQQIHAIHNAIEERAIILHVYAPPVTRQQMYEWEEEGSLEIVKSEQ